MATLATVGSEGHFELDELMRTTRAGGFDLLKARFDKAKSDGDLKGTADTTKLARFVQTVQSGMAIRARDGADRVELEAVAEIALAGWDISLPPSIPGCRIKPDTMAPTDYRSGRDSLCRTEVRTMGMLWRYDVAPCSLQRECRPPRQSRQRR